MPMLSSKQQAMMAIGLWALLVLTTLPSAQGFTPQVLVHAVLLFVKGVGALAMARGFMLLGVFQERQRLRVALTNDRILGRALTHILGGLAALLVDSTLAILVNTFGPMVH